MRQGQGKLGRAILLSKAAAFDEALRYHFRYPCITFYVKSHLTEIAINLRPEANRTKTNDSQSEAVDGLTPAPASSEPLNRRAWLTRFAAATVGGVLAVEGYVRYRTEALRSESAARYGRLSNPRFRVNEDLGLTGITPYQSELKAQLFDPSLPERLVVKVKGRIKALEDELVAIRKMLDKPGPIDTVGNGSALLNIPDGSEEKRGALDRLHSRITNLDTLLIPHRIEATETMSNSWSHATNELRAVSMAEAGTFKDHVKQFGSPEQYVKKLVLRITGVPVPDAVSFEVRAVDLPGAAGYSISATQKIVSQDGYFAYVALICAHEAGHLMALHEEETRLYPRENSRSEEEISNCEEACAYAFQGVASEAIGEEELRIGSLIWASYKRDLLDEFYSEAGSNECHRVGMAYYDAALTVLGSSAKAYNFLASHSALTSEMQQVLSENRELARQLRTSPNKPLREIEDLMTALKEKISAEIDRYSARSPVNDGVK